MASSKKSPRIEPTPETAPLAALAACLHRHVAPGERLCVALSGGIDSVVLLHALVRLGYANVYALHVHHGLSPHADSWAEFCASFAGGLGIPLECVPVTVARRSAEGLEAAARRARHAVFAAAAADWVLLAHQRNDQAETFLFNLLRGTGVAGAAAMMERRGRYLRPFLGIDRAAIAAYASAHGLRWVEDESNADLRHSRNFLRHRILPLLAARFPATVQNFAAAAARMAEAQGLLDDLARIDLAGSEGFPIAVAQLTALPEARARNALRYLLAREQVMIPSEARLVEALRQMTTAAADRHPAVSFGSARLIRRRGAIYLEKKSGPSTESR